MNGLPSQTPPIMHPLQKMQALRSKLDRADATKLDVGQAVADNAPALDDIKAIFASYMSMDPLVSELVATLQTLMAVVSRQHAALTELRSPADDERVLPAPDPATPAESADPVQGSAVPVDPPGLRYD